MVEGMGEDEEHEFEHETRGRGGVNLLGKAGRELAEACFDGFTKVLKQKGFVRLVRPPAILFARRLLAAAGRFLKHVFGHVVGVAGIGVEDAAFGQGLGQAVAAGLVGLRASVDVVLDGDAVGGGDELHLEAVEPAALAGAAPVIGLVLQQLTAACSSLQRVIRVLWHTAPGKESMT